MRDIAVEVLTPVQRNLNVEQKAIRKLLEDNNMTLKDHHLRHISVERAITGIQHTLLKELKNSDCDKSALQYELNRMQQLDRLKVAHAKDSFFNPDAGTLLPSLDTAIASCSQGGLSSTPQPKSQFFAPDRSLDHQSLLSERHVVT